MRHFFHSFILVITLLISGCSNSFLENEPIDKGLFSEEPIEITDNNGETQTLHIHLPEAYNSYFQIRQHPKYMIFENPEGHFSKGSADIKYKIDNEFLNVSGLNDEGIMVLDIKGYGLTSAHITLRNPVHYNISSEQKILDFTTYFSKLELNLQNQAPEDVSWKIIECPKWAKVESQNGIISAGEMKYFDVTCNRSIDMLKGRISGQLKIEFEWGNNISVIKTIPLSVEIIPYSTIEITGDVVDAIYCKETDRLFIATKNPDMLLVYHKEYYLPMSNIPLSRSPNCLSLSENGRQLFVGHDMLVSFVDVSSLYINVYNTYKVDFNVFDLAYGENGWLYMSSDQPWIDENLMYMNISNGFVLKNHSSTLYYGTYYLKKIKGKPLLLCSGYYQTVALIDISADFPNKTEKFWYVYWWGNRFWLSEDHKYTYVISGNIFLTPDFSKEDDLLLSGDINTPNFYANWMDHCEQTKSLWVANNKSWYDDNDSYISQYNSDSYNLMKSYNIADYSTTISGVFKSYKVNPRYVFSNKTGTRVFVINNILNPDESIDRWSLYALEIE